MIHLLRPIKTFSIYQHITATVQRFETRNFSEEIRNRLGRFKFLPDETMYIVKPYRPVADNVVIFHVPMKYTKFEIRNYLVQIYGLKVAKVNTMIKLGQTVTVRDIEQGRERKHQYPDIKVAYVILAEGKFVYPDIDSSFFTREQLEVHMGVVDDPKELDEIKKDILKKSSIKRTVS